MTATSDRETQKSFGVRVRVRVIVFVLIWMRDRSDDSHLVGKDVWCNYQRRLNAPKICQSVLSSSWQLPSCCQLMVDNPSPRNSLSISCFVLSFAVRSVHVFSFLSFLSCLLHTVILLVFLFPVFLFPVFLFLFFFFFFSFSSFSVFCFSSFLFSFSFSSVLYLLFSFFFSCFLLLSLLIFFWFVFFKLL